MEKKELKRTNNNNINLYDLFFKVSKSVFEIHPQFQIKWRTSYKDNNLTLQINLDNFNVAVDYLVSFESFIYSYPELKEKFFLFYVGDMRTQEYSIFFMNKKEIDEAGE